MLHVSKLLCGKHRKASLGVQPVLSLSPLWWCGELTATVPTVIYTRSEEEIAASIMKVVVFFACLGLLTAVVLGSAHEDVKESGGELYRSRKGFPDSFNLPEGWDKVTKAKSGWVNVVEHEEFNEQCEAGQGLVFLSATYGNSHCFSDVSSKVMARCRGTRSCQFRVSYNFFRTAGRCSGREFDAWVTCWPAEWATRARLAHALEGDEIRLNCPRNEKILIFKALLGYSYDTYWYHTEMKKCDGVSSCAVKVTRTALGLKDDDFNYRPPLNAAYVCAEYS